MHERSAAGKVQGGTWNESSRERKFHGMNGPGNEWSRERMFQGTNGSENESSITVPLNGRIIVKERIGGVLCYCYAKPISLSIDCVINISSATAVVRKIFKTIRCDFKR